MNNSYRAQWALTIARIMLGVVFIAHGSQKVLGLFGGPGLQGFVSWIGGYGVPWYLAYLAAFGEFVGGILLLLGAYAELGALMVMPVMLGAIVLVHRNSGFFIQSGGYEYVLTLFVFLVAIVIGGPGYLALLRHRR